MIQKEKAFKPPKIKYCEDEDLLEGENKDSTLKMKIKTEDSEDES